MVEEVIPFLEENIKIIAAEFAARVGPKTFFGKREGYIPQVGEMNSDRVVSALSKILSLEYEAVPESYSQRALELSNSGAPGRDLTFCAGCPHRASFWTIHNTLQMDGRQGFVCGDIGCYSLAMLPTGFNTLKTLHSMGSGIGLASGFGKLARFGMQQPVVAVVGDSTFFHAALPALINAIHHQSDITLVVLDNSGTAMTGFQSHPGLAVDATGNQAPAIDVVKVCQAMGATVRVSDPFVGTTWPLPPKLLDKYLGLTDKILVVEEVIPFLEENIKIIAAEFAARVGPKTFFGKREGYIPQVGEMNSDRVVSALSKILSLEYEAVPESYSQRALELSNSGAPGRDLTFCAGCPHRASFWTIHNTLQMDGRQGFVCGDIGCYSLAMLPTGFNTLKTLHSMGSGIGLASGFGKLARFGMQQPVVAVVGDSTFFHAALPALINAIHHQSDITLVVLDNSGTAMTGFQSHPGLAVDATGNQAPAIDVVKVCQAMGATVRVSDPFEPEKTQQTLFELFEIKGVKVLVLKQMCALSPGKKGQKDVRSVRG